MTEILSEFDKAAALQKAKPLLPTVKDRLIFNVSFMAVDKQGDIMEEVNGDPFDEAMARLHERHEENPDDPNTFSLPSVLGTFAAVCARRSAAEVADVAELDRVVVGTV